MVCLCAGWLQTYVSAIVFTNTATILHLKRLSLNETGNTTGPERTDVSQMDAELLLCVSGLLPQAAIMIAEKCKLFFSFSFLSLSFFPFLFLSSLWFAVGLAASKRTCA